MRRRRRGESSRASSPSRSIRGGSRAAAPPRKGSPEPRARKIVHARANFMGRRHPLRMLYTPFTRPRHVTSSMRRSVAALSQLTGALSLASACAIDAEPERLGFTDDHLVVTDDSPVAATPADFSGRWRGQAPDLLALDTGEGDP